MKYGILYQLTSYLLLNKIWTPVELGLHPIQWWMGCESARYLTSICTYNIIHKKKSETSHVFPKIIYIVIVCLSKK